MIESTLTLASGRETLQSFMSNPPHDAHSVPEGKKKIGQNIHEGTDCIATMNDSHSGKPVASPKELQPDIPPIQQTLRRNTNGELIPIPKEA